MLNNLPLVLPLILPLLTAILIVLINKLHTIRNIVNVFMALVTAVSIGYLFYKFNVQGNNYELRIFELYGGFSIVFYVDKLSMIYLSVLGLLWWITVIYAIGYFKAHPAPHMTTFFFFFTISIFAAIGIALSRNLITFFVFYEILTFSTLPLVGFQRDSETVKGLKTYLIVLLSTSVAFLFTAIVLTYSYAGTLEFTEGGILKDKAPAIVVNILLLLYLFGIAKVALMPAHKWLPAAMVAPTPVSALLHAVAVVKAGAFGIIKVVFLIFGLDLLVSVEARSWALILASISVIVASIIAIFQDSLKKRLAYSTIGQLAYITLGAMTFTSYGLIGSTYHILAHAFGKITLFFCAGAIIVTSHKKHVSQLSGIGNKMPVTMICFAIGTLSMLGLPPAVGMLSKDYLIKAGLELESYLVLITLTLSTILNAVYLLPILYMAFFKNANFSKDSIYSQVDSNNSHDDGHYSHGDANGLLKVAMIFTASMTVILFLFPNYILDFIYSIFK